MTRSKWFLTLTLLLSGMQFLAAEKVIPNYRNQERERVPQKYRWQLAELYPSSQAWENELKRSNDELKQFSAIVSRGIQSAKDLEECLYRGETLQRKNGRLSAYASLSSQVNWSDANIRDMSSKVEQFSIDLSIVTSQLENNIVLLKNRDQFVSDSPIRTQFGAYISELVRMDRHRLSPDEEACLSRMKLFDQGPTIAADVLRNRDMPQNEIRLPDGRMIDISGSNWWKLVKSPQAEERKAAHSSGNLNLAHFENTFAALLDTSVKLDVFKSSLKKFSSSLAAELFPYDVPETVYHNLVRTIRDNLTPLHRYIKLRKKVLKLSDIHPYDKHLEIQEKPVLRYSYEEAQELVTSATRILGSEYSQILTHAFQHNWIDVYGHKDKMNLGSAQFFPGVHPFVNLDYRGSFFDLITVAHELGHAISFHIPAEVQPFNSSHVNWFVSEVPSTFNEILLMRHLIKKSVKKEEKLALLTEYIDRLNLLVYGCTLLAELQLSIHEHVEQGGSLTPSWLNARQLELERHYYGHEKGVMGVDEYVKGNWNRSNTFFAPYQFDFYFVGAVVALAVIEDLEQSGTAQGYLNYLKSGSSRSIMDLLKEMGVDLNSPAPILRALQMLDQGVTEIENLLTESR